MEGAESVDHATGGRTCSFHRINAAAQECTCRQIFDGFWQSFTAACVTISIVMILSLRSVFAAVIAMIPNIIPIWLVFGSVGFLGMPVDIGMMMTGSIALGISVDCTFHFLVKYQTAYRNGATSTEAVLQSLEHSGEPMLDSTLISALGVLKAAYRAAEQLYSRHDLAA